MVLGDMPFVTAADYAALAAQLVDDRTICRPEHDGLPGHPVLFGRAWGMDFAALSGARGAGHFLAQFPEMVRHVRGLSPGVVRDIDIPEDVTWAAGAKK